MASKYRNIKSRLDGITFASKAEASRYASLKLLVSAGRIKDLTCQPRFKLEVAGVLICTYVGDFEYWDLAKSCLVVEDVKGVETAVFKLKRKLFETLYHRKIQIVRA